jgi:hypothetical protein
MRGNITHSVDEDHSASSHRVNNSPFKHDGLSCRDRQVFRDEHVHQAIVGLG